MLNELDGLFSSKRAPEAKLTSILTISFCRHG